MTERRTHGTTVTAERRHYRGAEPVRDVVHSEHLEPIIQTGYPR